MKLDASETSIPTLRAAAPYIAAVLVFFAVGSRLIGHEPFIERTFVWCIFERLFRMPMPTTWHFSPTDEIEFLIFNPGLYAGLIVGLTRMRSWKEILKGLIPVAVVLALLPFIMFWVPGGIWGISWLIVATISSVPYALLGAGLGWKLANRRSAALAVTLALCCSVGEPAWSYLTTAGHPYIADRGYGVLNQDSPNQYLEVFRFLTNIQDGTRTEDGVIINPTNGEQFGENGPDHFYNPNTSRADKSLNTKGFIWPHEDGISKAQAQWTLALDSYEAGDKVSAYNYLGHVAHIVTADFFQPQHVHDDPHGPPPGGDGQTIETLFDSNLALGGGITGRTPLVPAGGSPLSRNGVEAFGLTTSRITYGLSRFPGILISTSAATDGRPAGNISVGQGALIPVFVLGDNQLSNPDLQVDHYEIRSQSTLYYDPSVRGDIGVFPGSRHQDWWEPPSDEEVPGQQYFYFDQLNRVQINGQNLDAYFITQLIPNSFSYTAGIFKAAAQAFDPVPPTVELHRNDSQGSLIPDGGFGGGTIFLHAIDPAGTDPGGDPNHPTPSGIYNVVLKNLDTGAAISPSPQIAATGENPVDRTFSNLAEGHYSLTVYDGTGNKSSPLNIPIGKAHFLVGAQLRSVWQDEARGGLKFRKERRVYRQAGSRCC